jgi:hypothetical protein
MKTTLGLRSIGLTAQADHRNDRCHNDEMPFSRAFSITKD